MSKNNLMSVFERATIFDVTTGLESYRTYNRLTSAIATKYGFGANVGAAVFAALSPNNDYFGNLRDTDRVLKGVKEGKHWTDIKASTYTPNKVKAWEIARGSKPLDLIVAPKTRNFYLNVSDPEDFHPVTIDGHMLCAWRGKRTVLDDAKMNARVYAEVADGFRAVAKELGLITNQVQGVVWITWRRMHHVKPTTQLEMWDAEHIAARLGYLPVSRQ